MSKENIKWHPAFVAAIQLEFKEYNKYLEYSIEHELTHEPLKVDVVVIKKLENVTIDKAIGRMLKKYNVFEYKSPTDYISIDDYYKSKAYAYLYKVLSQKTNSIDIKEMTITLISNRHPKKLMEYLTSKGNTIIIKDPGVYHIENSDISTQIIVTKELPDEDVAYLKLLQIEHKNQGLLSNWINEYLINTKDPLYGVIMDVLAKSNINQLVEVYRTMGIPNISETNMTFLMDMVKAFELDKKLKAEGEIETIIKSKIEDILGILGDLGEIPKDLAKSINAQTDIEVLKTWVKLAAKSESIEDFKVRISK